MKTAFSASLLMLLVASYAQGQDDQNAAAQPTTAAPIETPPPPPEEPPAPPEQVQMQAPQATVPQSGQQVSTGQWVYTYQYGWLWMPYGTQYSYEPSTVGAYPYAYVYYPIYGWTWLTSPWVWGLGPLPYFGYYGPRHFLWYRGPGFHYSPWYGGYRGGPGWGRSGHGNYRGDFGHYQRGFGGYRSGMGGGHPGGAFHPGGGRGGGRR